MPRENGRRAHAETCVQTEISNSVSIWGPQKIPERRSNRKMTDQQETTTCRHHNYDHLVVHCKRQPYDVYVGRRSRGAPKGDSCEWGNPFPMKNSSDAERRRVVNCYRNWFTSQPELVAKAQRELKGKVLACWCSPKLCHGHVLAEIANSTGEVVVGEAATSAPSLSQKVHTSALCWIPSLNGEVYSKIQAIRQRHDRQIKRWPLHINLLYPFVPVQDFEESATKLAVALHDTSSFNVTLQNIQHFSHGRKSCTAWLAPNEKEQFVALQSACHAVFPHCDDLSSKKGGFTPHLTVGQCAGTTEVQSLIQEAGWSPSTTHCGEICLISRQGKDDPFVVHWTVQLGMGPTGVSRQLPLPSDSEADNKKRMMLVGDI